MFTLLNERNIQWRRCVMESRDSKLFVQEWNQFTEACGIGTNIGSCERALKLFKGVLAAYNESKESFNRALFEALQDVIGKDHIQFVGSERNVFVLKKIEKVGFMCHIDCDDLNLGTDRISSKNGQTSHSCVVFKCGKSTNIIDYVVQDTTAVVDLTFDQNNCNIFETNTNLEVVDEPIQDKGHTPVAQALLHGLDMWHCLARCGIQEKAIHVLVLGGRSNTQLNKNKLCCVDITINIPKLCSNSFVYNINRAVKFDDSNYEEIAIAAYLRVMRLGLQRASKIASQHLLIPISLCCHRLSFQGREVPEATLVASPIPGARSLTSGLSVHQGELFRWRPQKGWVARQGLVFDSSVIKGPILIKVCSTTVHNCYIHPRDCHMALALLYFSNNQSFKRELSKVLITCFAESGGAVIWVMHDLCKQQSNKVDAGERETKKQKLSSDTFFEPLYPINFQSNMSQLWNAFGELVRNVLVPMADEGVVHGGIRPGWTKTHKILCRTTVSEVELRLIDLGSIKKFPLPPVGDRRCMNDTYSTTIQSAHQFVWWQVMHVAYVWYEQLDEDNPNSLVADKFVNGLFNPNGYGKFKAFLGWPDNKQIDLKAIDKYSVVNLLSFVARAFNRREIKSNKTRYNSMELQGDFGRE